MKLLVTLKGSLGMFGSIDHDNIDYQRKIQFVANTVLFVYKMDNLFVNGYMLHSLDGAILCNKEYFSDMSIEPISDAEASEYNEFSSMNI